MKLNVGVKSAYSNSFFVYLNRDNVLNDITYILKLMGKKILTILHSNTCVNLKLCIILVDPRIKWWVFSQPI